MTAILRLIAVRSFVLIGGIAVFSGAAKLLPLNEDDGAPIGLGLLMFALIWGSALIWGIADGQRHKVVAVATAWGIVGALVGAALAVSIALTDSEVDREVFLSDLSTFVSMMAPSLLVLGLIGAAIGSVRPRSD